MTLKKQIASRKQKEASAAVLARKYARTKDYDEAAIWYRAASYHRAVAAALQDEAASLKQRG